MTIVTKTQKCWKGAKTHIHKITINGMLPIFHSNIQCNISCQSETDIHKPVQVIALQA